MPDTPLLASAPPARSGHAPCFDNSYARLPERLFARLPPTPVSAPRLLRLNARLAEEMGLDPAWLSGPDGVAMLAGNAMPDGAEPIAQAYAGHQFGQFVPSLGDGRAILIGEVVTPAGERRDIQLKGSGPTPFSRRGDGRAAVGPVLREYIVSEAMAAFGIPTTRSLAAVATGDAVFREDALPGAVLTRVAASHLRVGTFQYFAARRDTDALRVLAEHAIARHYPEAAGAANPVLALFEGVVARQAALVARWLLVGFIHGVMNTDNCAISGETIDYGPCAFLDEYHPEKVFSSIDQFGRYAYGNQPGIAHWNLARLAECLLPLISEDENKALELAQDSLAGFAPRFGAAWREGLLRKIGLAAEEEADEALVQDLFTLMAEGRADFTLTFRRLCDAAEGQGADAALRALFADPAAVDPWLVRWRARLAREGAGRAEAMRAVNPAYIPRNHLVEEAIAAAVQRDDLAPFEALLSVLERPFEEQPGRERYAAPPLPEERVLRTFCGT
ncbi:protein adenylyltransferase SelO [Neoroseomonas soli]|uniref:Protein nucleotidyltransferase YdiU n=1 Tax=Neoroseomonas soli TaxID=1081025 RepID=A0A9X9WSG8_9PROT|nr:YdiU family protein [Neoroseomonas soli]MBR0670097.1 YdiU family protein [Neoroseomonas soli]